MWLGGKDWGIMVELGDASERLVGGSGRGGARRRRRLRSVARVRERDRGGDEGEGECERGRGMRGVAREGQSDEEAARQGGGGARGEHTPGVLLAAAGRRQGKEVGWANSAGP